MKLKIRGKLLLSFGLLLIILLGSALFDFYQDKFLIQSIRGIYERPMAVNHAAFRLNSLIYAKSDSMKGAILARNENDLDRAVDRVKELERELEAQLRIMERLVSGEKGKVFVSQIRSEINSWNRHCGDVISLLKSGSVTEAADLNHNAGQAHVISLLGKRERLIEYAGGAYSEIETRSAEAMRMEKLRLSIEVIFITVIGALIIIYVSFSLATRVERLGRAASKIAGGELDTVEMDGGNDEITSLAGSFNHMVSELSTSYASLGELRESERRFRETLENVKMVAVQLDDMGGIIFVNDYLLDLTGWRREEVVGENWFDYFIEPESRETVKQIHRRLITAGGGEIPSHYDNPIITRDGRLRYISWNNTILRNPEGSVTGVTSIGEDVTGRMATEKALRESEERLRVINASVNEAIIMIDGLGRAVYWNPAAVKIFGYSEDEALGQTIEALIIPPDMRDKHRKGITTFSGSGTGKLIGRTIELAGVTKAGRHIPIELSLAKMQIGGAWHAVGIVRDITSRKEAEKTLVRLATAINQSDEVVIITDVEGIIQYVNPAFERITGYSREESLGEKTSILKSGKHDAAFYKTMWETIKTGKSWKGRITNQKKDGGLYEEEVTISPIFDSSGGIINFVSVKRDVTREIALEKQVRQSQKMEAVGTLAGGIAHDFNNILFAILGHASLLKAETPNTDGEHMESLNQIIQASRRGQNLVHQVLAFSRRTEQEFRPLNPAPIVKEALNLLDATLPPTIELRKKIDSDSAGYIKADPTQVHQVVMNLCMNAAHAIGKRDGVIEVSMRPVEINEETAATHPDLKQGPYMELAVTDTGHGVDREIAERIFEPFFTTKDVGEGTGLGLAVAHGIVMSHGGGLIVESEHGEGSKFIVFFPKVDMEAGEETVFEEDMPRGSEHILFVDDDEAIVKLGKYILEKLGYKVTVSTRAEEAVEMLRASAGDYDLLITDFSMPKMLGSDLAKEALSVRPNLPVIMMSGYFKPGEDDGVRAIGVSETISKNFHPAALARAVRRVLEQASAERSSET